MPDTKQAVSSFRPVQNLYEWARDFIDGRAPLSELRDAVEALEEAARVNDSLEHVRERARDLYVDSTCDIDIDDANLTHHNGLDGYWVGAWLWVGEPEVENHDDA